MKEKNKFAVKALCVSFVLLFLCTGLLGCAENKPTQSDTTDNASTVEAATAVETSPQPDVPDVTFAGRDVTFLVTTETLWGYEQIDADALNAEPVNDAIYNRNRAIEDKYKIKIQAYKVEYTQVQANVEKSYKANSFEYDIIIPRLNVAVTLASEGMLMSVDELEYVDMKKPWWDEAIVDDLTINNKLYFMAGDIHMYANDATWVLLFNKALQKKLDIEDMYQLVYDGNWTIDKFNEIIKYAVYDSDPGKTEVQDNDRIGFVTLDLSVLALISGSGEQIFTKNSAGSYDFNITSDRFVSVYDKVLSVMNEDQSTMNASRQKAWKFPATGSMIGDSIQAVFESDRALFVGEVVDCISRYSNMDSEFGILPFPKYDKDQKQYISVVVPDAMVIAVPSLLGEQAEELSIILEAMCAASYDTVKPAYYEVTLKRKKTSDAESAGMLDIIFGKDDRGRRTYPIDLMFGWGGVTSALYDDVGSNTNNLASRYAKLKSKVAKAMEKTHEKFAQ